MVDNARMTRRSALCFIGGGAIVAAGGFETFGVSSIEALRGTTVDTVDDQDAFVGLVVSDTVEKNTREVLVEVTNHLSDDITVTVSLNDGTQGTLYGPDGDSGNSVSFSLVGATTDSTDSGIVEIESGATDGTTIPFTIDAATPNADFTFQGTRETTVSKNADGSGVVITTLKNFKARANKNYWEVGSISVESDQYELDRVEYEITDEAGTVVGELTDNATGFTYDRSDVRIEPNDGETITKKTEYTLTVRAYDVEGNYDVGTATDTA